MCSGPLDIELLLSCAYYRYWLLGYPPSYWWLGLFSGGQEVVLLHLPPVPL